MDVSSKNTYVTLAVPPDIWDKRKKEFLDRIKRDIEIGYLDPGIERYLEIINTRKDSYTTSSCLGRVTIIDSEAPWIRGEGRVVFKKHGEVTPEELEEVLSVKPRHTYWIIATGPILHVMTRTLEEAVELLSSARKAGFKHSGLTSVSEKGFLVEIISSTQLVIPARHGDILLVANGSSLSHLAYTLNQAVREGRKRLEALAEELEK